MTRQSISFTEPNAEWLAAQIESKEYSSKSEIVNDLIRQARRHEEEIELIRAELVKGEESGFLEEVDAIKILEKSKKELRRNGELQAF